MLFARRLGSHGGECPRGAQGSFREHVGGSAVLVRKLEVGKQGTRVHGLEGVDETICTWNCREED
jgi:hypothetical protein